MTSSSTLKSHQNYIKSSLVYFGQCLQSALLYRSALAVFMVSEAFAYAGFMSFWYMAAVSNPNQSVYTPIGLIAYFALASFHHGVQHHGASRDIRPFPYLLQTMLRSLATTITYFVLLSPFLIGAFVFIPGLWDVVHSNNLWLNSWHYLLALIIGLATGWCSRVFIGLLAFDMTQIWGPDTFFIALYFSVSGSAYPVDLLPSWALNVAKWTPMYYMVGFPVLTFMGRIPANEFNSNAAQGCVVFLSTACLVAILWKRGMRRFEAIGI
jgi:ABC-type uncharacterized transport system permease subunit